MSRMQIHRIKSFILRHAWLNLWDKHMTTGRINQVTFLEYPTTAAVRLPSLSTFTKYTKVRGVKKSLKVQKIEHFSAHAVSMAEAHYCLFGFLVFS